jgi:hypothetical protein
LRQGPWKEWHSDGSPHLARTGIYDDDALVQRLRLDEGA